MSFGTCITARVSVRSLEVMSLIGLPLPRWRCIGKFRTFDSERLGLDSRTMRYVDVAVRREGPSTYLDERLKAVR